VSLKLCLVSFYFLVQGIVPGWGESTASTSSSPSVCWSPLTMVSPSDLLQPCWPPQQLRGKLPVLPASSIASISVCSIPTPVTCMHRRSDTLSAKFRWPIGSGATTILLALIPCFNSTYPCDLIRNKSGDSSLIWELRFRWHHRPWPVNKVD
jgi:hypothetical protein